MSTGPNAAWLEQFATRLLQADPTTTPLDAVRLAIQTYPAAAGLDPRKAAEAFSLSEQAGLDNPRPLADRTRTATSDQDRTICNS